jgi:ribonuclease-3
LFVPKRSRAPQAAASREVVRRRTDTGTLAENERQVLDEFQRTFHIQFRNQQLLKLALTHRSYLHVTGAGPRDSNERLEYLGDSVLGLVTSEFLYRTRPDEHEGQLTKTKSLLVSKAILSRRALAMRLGRYVLMSHSEMESGGRQRLSILADAFESVIGAIYLDQGFESARTFIDQWLLRESRVIVADKRHTNYKSHLQEYVQSTFRTHPVYRIRSAMGPDHSKQFMVEVLVGRRVLGEGRGQNKKDAEQAAARDALDRVGHTPREEREARPVVRDAAPPAPPAVVDEDEDDDDEEMGRRRRGRRGGRGRREREDEPSDRGPVAAGPVAERPAVERYTPPPPPPRPVIAARDLGGRSVPRPHAAGAPHAPLPPMPASSSAVAPPTGRFRPQLEEDEHEEIGRPEGPVHESDLAARAWPAPEPSRPRAPVIREPGPAPVPVREPQPVEPEEVVTPEPAVPDDDDRFESWSEPEPEAETEWPVEEPAVAETTHAHDDDASRAGGFIEMEPEVSAPSPAPAPSSSTTPEPSPPAPSFGRRPGRVKRPFKR